MKPSNVDGELTPNMIAEYEANFGKPKAMNWYERRNLALQIADEIFGYDRVPGPERFAEMALGRVPRRLLKTNVSTGEQWWPSRQSLRQREREEEKEPILSYQLTKALEFKSQSGIFISQGRYEIGFVGATRERRPLAVPHRVERRRQRDAAMAALGLPE